MRQEGCGKEEGERVNMEKNLGGRLKGQTANVIIVEQKGVGRVESSKVGRRRHQKVRQEGCDKEEGHFFESPEKTESQAWNLVHWWTTLLIQ